MCLSVVILFVWTISRYKQTQFEKEQEYMLKYPFRDVDHPLWSAQITLVDGFLADRTVNSMLVHIFTALFVRIFDELYILNTIHLFMIYNISRIVRNIIRAIIEHIDQLAVAFVLMLFVIFVYAIWIMQMLKNNEWKDPEIDCTNLYNC